MADQETLAVYAERAVDYAERFQFKEDDRHLQAFMARLPDEAHVLDLGCGGGNASALMIASGLQVVSWDASPEMGKVAREVCGVDVREATFDDLDALNVYDGIYANFSLLHAPRAEMAGHLARISDAIKPGGAFHIGLKTGTGERRDALGRFYCYYTEEEIRGLLADAGFDVLTATTGEEPGLDGVVAPFIILLSEKRDV